MKPEVTAHEVFGVVEGEAIKEREVVGGNDEVNAVARKDVVGGLGRGGEGDRVGVGQTRGGLKRKMHLHGQSCGIGGRQLGVEAQNFLLGSGANLNHEGSPGEATKLGQ